MPRLLPLFALSVLALTGCAGWAPQGRPVEGPAAKAPPPPAPGHSPWTGPPPNAGVPGGPPGYPGGPPAYPGGFGEQAAFFSQKMANLDDEKRGLTSRIALLEARLLEKDRALAQASFDLQEAAAEISRTREDLDRWKADMEKLRVKLRVMEKDSKVTLETIIHTLEQMLDREPEARRPINLEELLPPPRKNPIGPDLEK